MGTIPKLHEYLLGLDFLNAKSSRDFIGTKDINPGMFLEENVPVWSKTSTLAEISAALAVLKERVCIGDFPARYSPPFWLAHAALQTVYKVLNSFLLTHFSEEVLQEVSDMLFDLWIHLISAGPGSTHLEMMDVILKNQHFPLWKYMESLKGDNLKLLLTTLKCDFVYQEDVSSDHYATLMETQIDKIFKLILKPEQFQEAQRVFLELHLHYLSRMNHVPPHIGPRLSHLCFLICQKYEMENPYLGLDDWVLMRHHLKVIKEVVTDRTFTIASEAQYRAPITLEKIFQAALHDNMMELMFKDFMLLLLTVCAHNNSKKCKRLFLAYRTALFQQIDVSNMAVQPEWLFDQCITALTQVASTHNLETHIEEMVRVAEHECLLKMTDLFIAKKEKWHKLLENFIVSGRKMLVQEATYLLEANDLKDTVFNWKANLSQARLLIDIIADLPKSFLQDDSESTVQETVTAYAALMTTLISQLRDADLISKMQDNLHKCVIKCLSKNPDCKSKLASICVQEVVNHQDLNFLREMLFCVEKLLKSDECLSVNETLSSVVESLLTGCLNTFSEKGYIPVDYNSLMISVSLTCISGDQYIQTDDTGPPYDIYLLLYNSIVLQFVRMHQKHGTLKQAASLVLQVIQQIHESIKQGTSIERCVTFLHWLGTSCPELLTGHMTEIMELFLDWECYQEIYPILTVMYPSDPLSAVQKVPLMVERLKTVGQTDRQTLLSLLHLVAENHAQVFTPEYISQLVNMYKQETTTSQQLILQIIHRVALSCPNVVFGFYAQFTDDNKFPVTSLKNRAPILIALTQHSEDVAKKTTDYLMLHVSSKDSAISLVAMETLEPLLRQSPACLIKHKQQLKAIGKTTSSARVKEICKQLVPDAQVKSSKSIQNDQKENKLNKQEARKNSFGKPRKEMGKVSNTSRSQKILTAKETSFDSAVQPDESSKVPETHTDSKFDDEEEETLDGTEEVHIIQPKKQPVVQSIPESLKNEDSSLTVKTVANEKVLNTLSDKDTNAPNTQIVNKDSSGQIYASYVKSDITVENVKADKKVTYTQKDTVQQTEAKTSELQLNKVEPPNLKITSMSSDSESTLKQTLDDKEGSESVKHSGSMLSNSRSDPLMDYAPVYLSYHTSCQDKVSMLRRHLKMAGYECWVDTRQTGSGDRMEHIGIQEAKVVICCLTKLYLSSSECCNEISAARSLSKPVIPLALEPISGPPTSLLKDCLAIRFYTKPDEVKVTMGFWVEQKFQQLLMQLSYLKILPDEKIITKAYENWWLPRQQTDGKSTVHDETETKLSTGGFPNVFISYNWGKQKQVKTLYQQLTDQGYNCWLGVYQMSGSESLYNKITQGLQGCRVMLACVTKKYTRAENCQQEVRLAHSLKRPIIPLLIEEVRWPPADEMGKILVQYECIEMKFVKETKILDGVQFDKLMNKLNAYLPSETKNKDKNHGHTDLTIIKDERDNKIQKNEIVNIDKKKKQTTGNTLKSVIMITSDHTELDKPLKEEPEQVKSIQKTMQKSSSMFEIEKASELIVSSSDTKKIVTSKTDDDLIIRRNIPEGVIVDEMGYTVKSSRSKSCVIL